MTVTLDVERLAAAIRYIDANPLRWFQGSWGRLFLPESKLEELGLNTNDFQEDQKGQRVFVEPWSPALPSQEACQTAFCVAGWVAHQAVHVDKVKDVKENWSNDKVTLYTVTVNAQELSPGDAAVALLVNLDGYDFAWEMPYGTDRTFAGDAERMLHEMFGGDNTRTDIQHHAENFARLAGVEWPVPLPEWADPEDTHSGWYQEEATGFWVSND